MQPSTKSRTQRTTRPKLTRVPLATAIYLALGAMPLAYAQSPVPAEDATTQDSADATAQPEADAAATSLAEAQDAAAEPPAAQGGQRTLGSVTVTAQKREENLQEVPLSVAVFDTEALRERNIQSVYDVATFTPNFSFQRNSVGRRLDAPSIRGQFTPLQNFGSEGNVAFYVDGAYVSGTASGLTVDNLERVEVLRGPQVAQFGRGAFAGAIHYVTKAPNPDELEGQV